MTSHSTTVIIPSLMRWCWPLLSTLSVLPATSTSISSLTMTRRWYWTCYVRRMPLERRIKWILIKGLWSFSEVVIWVIYYGTFWQCMHNKLNVAYQIDRSWLNLLLRGFLLKGNWKCLNSFLVLNSWKYPW